LAIDILRASVVLRGAVSLSPAPMSAGRPFERQRECKETAKRQNEQSGIENPLNCEVLKD